ncbi:MAG: hypothetical protein C0490_01175, partial [Marivirga sp.]|nr:hypothetical protein [Marivirga sp.]
MEKYLLKFLDLFAWAFRMIPVDYPQLRAIVTVKLLTDNRRQHIAYRKKSQKESGNAFIMTLFFYGIFGIFVALALYTIQSFMLSMIVFFSYIMVMISMTLITDFSSILLDTSDNTIILPRPVDGRTLFVSRVTHILLYLGQLTIALCLIPAIAVFMMYGGLVLSVFILAILLSVITSVFITNGLYLLILQFATEEKLKNIINYFQIVMAVVIMGGYQILPRIMERINMETFVYEIQWWNFLLPPIWMAGALEMIHRGVVDGNHIGLILLATVIPPLGAYMVNKYLTPIFNRKLGALSGSVEHVEKEQKEKRNFLDDISKWITFSSTERASFDLIFKILGRDRKIKLKIYPAFGYIVIFGLIFIMRGKEDFGTTLGNLPDTEYHLMLLYLTFMVLQVALYEIPYSDDFKASWIYFSTPIEKPGEMLSGMIKAIFVRLFVPGYIIISAFVLFIWGGRVIDDILFGMLNNVLMLITLALINKKHLPLSMAPNVRTQTGNLMRSILSFFIIGVLGAGHYLLT